MLIKTYGMFWNPDIVDWGKKGAGNRGKLMGSVKIEKKKHTIDFWNCYGIYILHDDFKPIYVGKAAGTPMGARLCDHLTDRFAGRWDMFSWFSLSKVNVVTHNVSKPGRRCVNPETVNDTLEALSILIADPPLNRKRESIPFALEAKQEENPNPRTIRSYLENILDRLPPTPVPKAKKQK